MKKKSIFTKILLIVVVALICLVLTVLSAFLLGSVNTKIFDFSNLNFANMLPVLLIGGFISCLIIGLLVLFLAKDVFVKVKNHLFDEEKDGGKEK